MYPFVFCFFAPSGLVALLAAWMCGWRRRERWCCSVDSRTSAFVGNRVAEKQTIHSASALFFVFKGVYLQFCLLAACGIAEFKNKNPAALKEKSL